MKSLSDIQDGLKDFTFTSYPHAIRSILTALGLPESTASRLSKLAEDNINSPIYVYRKAVLLYSPEISISYIESLIHPYKAIPLAIVFTPNGLFLRNETQVTSYYSYSKVWEHIDELDALTKSTKGQKDIYRAKDFGELIAGLYNSLILSENTKEASIFGVFNIIKISLFTIGSCREDIRRIASTVTPDPNKQYNDILEKCKDFSFIGSNSISITNDSIKYIRAIVDFDSENIDIEILSSLVYKLFSNDATLYGPQTTYQNVEKVIQPLIFEELQTTLSSDPSQYTNVANHLLNSCFIDPTNGPGCFISTVYSDVKNFLCEIDNANGSNYSDKLDYTHFVSLIDNEVAANLTQLTLAYSILQYIDDPTIDQINDIFKKLRIVICNQLETDWMEFTQMCEQTYILGSPRFWGFKKLPTEHKATLKKVFGKSVSDSDYCSGWLVKAATYISAHNCKAAFVLTNSIVQGAQVPEIWETIYNLGVEIFYAYNSFKWKGYDSAANVGVTVIVIGIQKRSSETKHLYYEGDIIPCECIGPYLIPNDETIVKRANSNLFDILPSIRKGNMPYDEGHLLIDSREEYTLLIQNAEAKRFIKEIVGSEEFIKAIRRWCLWIPDNDVLEKAEKIDKIKKRIEDVRTFRASSTASEKCKANPHQFRETYSTDKGCCSLVVPSVSSENRPYIPIGFISDRTIVSNLAFAVYNCEPWVLCIISSSMHMLWMKTVCGALETRYRYSNVLCYNTFPLPYISDYRKRELTSLAYQLIAIREKHCEKSLGQLYNEMPDELCKVHNTINDKIESLYQDEPFLSDIERLSCLMNLYKTKVNNG